MMNAIVLFFRFIFSHKWKFVLVAFSSLFFLIYLFPLSDLNDYISIQVAKLTNNRIYVQFDAMSLNPFTTSLDLSKVVIETPQTSSLTSDQLSLSPSISALISSKPGGTIKAHGFLKGDLTLHMSPLASNAASDSKAKTDPKGKKSDTTSELKSDKYKIEASAQNISLKEAKDIIGISMPIKGQLNFNTQATADLSFIEQPEMDITLQIQKFELPVSSVSLQDFGRINLPEIKLNQIELKGKLSNGKFQIETGKIGTSKDDFYGDIKGDMNITFLNAGGQVTPQFGNYSLSLELKANTAFKERAKFFLNFLDGYKKEQADGTTYKFKIQADAGMSPQFTPLQ